MIHATGEEHVQRGITICHLRSSLQIASMYGRRDLSSKVGSLSLDITELIWVCARLCTSGWRVSATMKEDIVDEL